MKLQDKFQNHWICKEPAKPNQISWENTINIYQSWNEQILKLSDKTLKQL